ncbi:MAG: hypothetical protein M1814_006811 [Vezdaea aestivalis]|nr:MAG: hypothetical protein M1814_006811 [Vezdaea aestivalis]
MAESAAKRFKINSPTIGTHNGHFHADEALAVYMLRRLPAYKDANLVRTRDPALLAECHTVVDVGGEYSSVSNRYDHHQRTFDTTFPSRPTKLSSAGLIYLHFGKSLIAHKLNLPEESENVDKVWQKVYEQFVEALDANDNGISSVPKGTEKNFSEGGIKLPSLMNMYNLQWNEDPGEGQTKEDEQFGKASTFMGEMFDAKLRYYCGPWLEARSTIYDAIKNQSGQIIEFQRAVPWKDHLITGEDELGIPEEDRALYVLYPEKPTPDSKWRIQATPVTTNGFESKKALPEAWRGLRDDALDKITGVDGCVFVHASGFIGGAKTYEGARKLAEMAVAM